MADETARPPTLNKRQRRRAKDRARVQRKVSFLFSLPAQEMLSCSCPESLFDLIIHICCMSIESCPTLSEQSLRITTLIMQ